MLFRSQGRRVRFSVFPYLLSLDSHLVYYPDSSYSQPYFFLFSKSFPSILSFPLLMSGQPPYQINEPYSTTLSLLRRIDVLRLCLEFKISSEGTVVFLKKQIKKHLNDNRETLYRNPRYTPLYPKHRRLRNSPAPSFLNSNISLSCPPSPDLPLPTSHTEHLLQLHLKNLGKESKTFAYDNHLLLSNHSYQ